MQHFARYTFFVFIVVLLTISSRAQQPEAESIADTTENIESSQSIDEYENNSNNFNTLYFSAIKDTAALKIRTLNDSAFIAFRSNPEFDYSKNIPQSVTWWNLLKEWFFSLIRGLISKDIILKAWGLARYLIIAAAVLAVVLLFTRTGIRALFSRSPTAAPTFDIISEDIHEVDFPAEIARAAEQGNYRIAVRFMYLQTLKRLSDAEIISWESDKTNRDYAIEILNSRPYLSEYFKIVTIIFEHVQYGKYTLDESEYSRISSSFEEFANALYSSKIKGMNLNANYVKEPAT